MEFAVMHPAQRHDELVAHPATKRRPRLPESKVVSIGRAPAANQAGLRTYKLSMRLIMFPDKFQKWCRRFGIHNATRLGARDVAALLRGHPASELREF